MNIVYEYDRPHRRAVIGGEPMILHCHHYNTYLQRTILETRWVDSRPILVGAGHEVAFAQLTSLLADIDALEARVKLAQELYRWAGFGTVALEALGPEGGVLVTPSSHYALGWKVKFGISATPVCFFTSGWLAGALEAIHGLSAGSLHVEETACAAMAGHTECRFELRRQKPAHALYESPGTGRLHTHSPVPETSGNVDSEGILTALSSMPVQGDDEGIIAAFGVMLTRHYANYYNRISFEFERAIVQAVGPEGLEASRTLLVEAGQICAFHTFGGIMESSEWDALVLPSLVTREDWVHAMVAAVNAFGWGRWQVTIVSEKEALFTLHDDYESVGYLALYGPAPHPVSYLAEGGVMGLMNLVYIGDIMNRPVLDRSFYESLSRRSDLFHAVVEKSQAMGDDTTVIRVLRD